MISFHRRHVAFFLATGFLAFVLTGCGDDAPGGHSHAGDQSAHAHDEVESVSVTAWTDDVEIFAEHPVMVAGQRSAAWAIHVTTLSDYRPLAEGAITLRFRRPDGAAYVHTADAPSRPGIYTPQPEIPEAGSFRLFAIVKSPVVQDTVDLGPFTVYDSASEARVTASEPEIAFLKEQQWRTAFSIAKAEQRSVQASVSVPGRIDPDPGRYAQVSAPVSGLVPARRNTDLPAAGDRVREGQRLGVLTPTSGSASYAELKARVERLRREVDRAERLYDAEAIPEKQLIEARRDLDVANATLTSMGGGGANGFDYTLRSPIAGQIHERAIVAGGQVDVGSVLYTIIDPSRVRLRLRVPARYVDRIGTPRGATFTVEGSERRYRTDRVASVGAVLDPETRTLPVHLRVSNPDNRLKVGLIAKANLLGEDEETGTAIPTSGIQIEDGRPVAYVEIQGEGFERRPLDLGATDGAFTIVRSGVAAGEHVVTEGAYQVYLASLNASEVGGHGHPH